MSDSSIEQPLAIRLTNVGKLYRLYDSALDSMLDLSGLNRIFHRRKTPYREYWALRGINLEVPIGSRLGIIGQNGAGKSTLLKLISRNFAPTEGKVEVHGQIQALMTAGAGFHPEFTGVENVRASLVYQGLSPSEIEATIVEIKEFTELGQFMDQPFKTYSAGMQARLTFATATTIKPELLIVDEVLGAGDGYFISKASERMQRLIEDSGATVIIVSHGLDQITRFCSRVIWLERGQIIQEGPALEVVKAYDQHLRILNERRIRAKDKASTPNSQFGFYGDSLIVRLVLHGALGATCALSAVTLFENGQVYERLQVGAAQDSNTNQPAFLQTDEASAWSRSSQADGRQYRTLAISDKKITSIGGQANFYMYKLDENSEYVIDVEYRSHNAQSLTLEIWKTGVLHQQIDLLPNTSDWQTQKVILRREQAAPVQERTETLTEISGEMVRKWPAEGSLIIAEITLHGENNREQRSFEVGTPFTIRMTIQAKRSNTYTFVPVVVLYRLDGVVVTKYIGEPITDLQLRAGERRDLALEFGPLNLGNGNYVFSPALYQHLDPYAPVFYDVIDRSFEFEVFGTPPLESAIFQHPGRWHLVPSEDRIEISEE
jgi:lipopolysaccharide transport system ATP-binding protein